MTAGGNGDDGRAPPRPAADTPGKAAVRASEPGAKDSLNMGAADTAVAMVSSTGETIAAGTGAGTDAEPEKPAAEEDLLLGTTLLGRYQITKKIGQGGMGAVYEGTHTLIGKRVAVKV